MKEKKQSANWNIAATHYLTAGFAIPFVLSLIIGIPMVLLLGSEGVVVNVGNIVVAPLIVWLGVIYSAKYVNKTYVISDSQKVINLATIYLIVIAGGLQLRALVVSFDTISILGIVRVIVMAGTFYIASKKYLHNTEQAEAEQEIVGEKVIS
jgi:hypothetical protein